MYLFVIKLISSAINIKKSNMKIPATKLGLDHTKSRFIDQGYTISKERMKGIGEPYYSLKEKGKRLGLMTSHKSSENMEELST